MAGALLLLLVPRIDNDVLRIALVVVGAGLTGAIYVVCPPMIGEFVPVAQRGAMLAICGATYSLAGVLAPAINGGVIDAAATPLQGYLHGFQITAWRADRRRHPRLAAALPGERSCALRTRDRRLSLINGATPSSSPVVFTFSRALCRAPRDHHLFRKRTARETHMPGRQDDGAKAPCARTFLSRMAPSSLRPLSR